MKGIIYKATNVTNGEGYVGQSIEVIKRIKRHKSDALNGTDRHFYNAIRKYGWDAFEWEVLYFNIPQNQLGNMERWCIASHDTYRNGYNSTEGGEDNPMNNPDTIEKIRKALIGKGKGVPKSKEHRKKIGDAQRGRTLSVAHIAKMTGENNPQYGKPRSEKIKAKISKTSERFKWIITCPEGKNETTTNLRKYCREKGLDHSSMSVVASGKNKHHKGFKCAKLKNL